MDAGQKTRFVLPAFIARLVLGEMGEEFLLASRRMQPAKLLAAGYCFRFPDLADTLRHERHCLNAGSATNVIDKTPSPRTEGKESQS
jgi:hypothetical protein